METKSLHMEYDKAEITLFDDKLCTGYDLEEEKETERWTRVYMY